MQRKRLALLRHAKSSWDDSSLADQDRPLSPRGRRAAKRLGRYLRHEGFAPDLVLCSPAARTRQTLDRLELDDGVDVLVEEKLYGASADELLHCVQAIPDRVSTALVIGHNPGIEDLAICLSGQPARLEPFPTGAFAELHVAAGAWSRLSAGGAVLHSFVTPRELG